MEVYMNIKRIIQEEMDDLSWMDDISPYLTPYMDLGVTPNVGDKVICLPGFSHNSSSLIYGGAGYKDGKVYTVQNISDIQKGIPNQYDVIWGQEDINRGVFLKALAPYEEIIQEEVDDLSWMDDIPTFNLNDIVEHNRKDFIVAIWFNEMDDDIAKGITNFIYNNGYRWRDSHPRILEELRIGKLKGITFYPSRSMGMLYNRESWDSYHHSVYNNQYRDVSPDLFYSVEI